MKHRLKKWGSTPIVRNCGSTPFVLVLLGACVATPVPDVAEAPDDYYGTLEPFAAEAVYFIVTDRFVDGDLANNHVDQGGSAALRTFDRPIRLEGEAPANIGYLGGDFRGVADNAGYIAEMGFTAVWLTPIVANPDEAFTGGARPGEGGSNDRGKTGYHGYWGTNFYAVDEHLESEGLRYADLTRRLREEHGLKTILDVVCNHGSPSFSMPEDQPGYGELYDADGTLVADHQNLHPTELDPDNPLHAFYRREPDLAELGDLDFDNPDVLDYCAGAQLQWLAQGAAALRIDTIKHMPHYFWKAFADRVRAEHPGLFMFGEAWSWDAPFLAEFTQPENGGYSVLDFPGRAAMLSVFGSEQAPYSSLESYLHLDTGVYANPYDLMTFYDNHDMTRLDADANGFIDANNWLFTSRGIPVVYYGSEVAFRAGTDQHAGNRDYFGQDEVDAARSHPVHAALTGIANVRKASIALQRGLQVNDRFDEDGAVFYRVYQKDGVCQTALVFLNRRDAPRNFNLSDLAIRGNWRNAVTGQEFDVERDKGRIYVKVPAHGVLVYLSDDPVTDPWLTLQLDGLMRSGPGKP